MKPTSGKKAPSARKDEKGRLRSQRSDELPIRQLKMILLAALAAGAVAGLVLFWNRIFPTPPEDLVEVVWTHQCQCADGWIESLREKGFVVRDFELDTLGLTRKQWNVPAAARGCHPARYMGYIIDGHAPPEILRKLGREHPAAVGLIQVSEKGRKNVDAAGASRDEFELIEFNGGRRRWP